MADLNAIQRAFALMMHANRVDEATVVVRLGATLHRTPAADRLLHDRYRLEPTGLQRMLAGD